MAEHDKPTDPLAATVGSAHLDGTADGPRADSLPFDATITPPLAATGSGDPGEAGATDAIEAALDLDGAARYAEGELLGRGGMGEVRRFLDRRLGRDVARKTLHLRGAAEARRRFLREVWVQARLDHPSVVPVFDVARDAHGDVFFTMRRVQGATLRDVLERLRAGDAKAAATWTRRKLLTAFASVCLTIHYAHTRGVVHRDLKPENVMVGEFGEVYVLDWGVAKVLSAVDDAPLRDHGDITARGAVLGTPAYMAPEQVEGRSEAQDARSDVHALGCILFELLAGEPLHGGTTVAAIAVSVLGEARRRPSDVAADVAPELDEICLRATARDPAARFPSARALADAIERHLDGDRDLARRRQLAAEHVERATRALAAADARARFAESRGVAMKEVARALALDADQADARKLLVELLTEEPPETPPAVERDIARADEEQARRGLRTGLVGLLCWLASIPLVVAIGVRDWRAIGPVMGLVVASTGYVAWISRRRDAARHSIPIALLLGAMAAGFSAWLGPFVLTPLAALSVTIYFVLHGPRRWRWPVSAILAAAAIAPFVLEWAHLVPPSHRFEGGSVVLLPRGMFLSPLPTELALVWICVSFVVLGALVTARVRDALAQAQARVLLHSWRLRQLAPDERTTGERDAIARGG